jgi:hypothetical protein
MAMPQEFAYQDEADFTAKLLIPLLQRLGFSLVVNYHGSREFGKDLVFGEIDHFGHIRYHGLQAKYVESIGLKDVQGLIDDCKQAFANPFRHPHTGAMERISTFYAVNGGSISDQAKDHFFNSLSQPYGGNIRLIDGAGLLVLDRWAAANRSQTVLSDLNGLRLEIGFNRKVAMRLDSVFRDYVEQYGLGTNISKPNPVPSNRFRLNATERYLERPFVVDTIPAEEIEAYWERASLSNAMMDTVASLTTVLVVDNVVQNVLQHIPAMDSIANSLEKRIREVLATLGPLTGV